MNSYCYVKTTVPAAAKDITLSTHSPIEIFGNPDISQAFTYIFDKEVNTITSLLSHFLFDGIVKQIGLQQFKSRLVIENKPGVRNTDLERRVIKNYLK